MQNFITIPYLDVFDNPSSLTVAVSQISNIYHDADYCTFVTPIETIVFREGKDAGPIIYECIKNAITSKPGIGIITVEFPFVVTQD